MVIRLLTFLLLVGALHGQVFQQARRMSAVTVADSLAGSTATSPHNSASFLMQPGYTYLAVTYHSGGSTVMTNLVGSSHTSPTWSIIASNNNVALYTSVWAGTTTANSSGVVSNICGGDTGGGIIVLRCRGLTNTASSLRVQWKGATNTTANPSVTMDSTPASTKRNLVLFSVVTSNNGSTSSPEATWDSEELGDGGGYNTPATSFRCFAQRRADDASLIITDATGSTTWAGLAVELQAQ